MGMSEIGKLRKQAKRDLEDYRLTVRRAKRAKGLTPEMLELVELRAMELKKALRGADAAKLQKAVDDLEEFLGDKLGRFRPNAFWETVKALLIAVMIALFIRWMFIEPFRIPSGSMIPTLLIGDQLMVNRMAFGPDIFVPYFDLDQSPPSGDELKKQGAIRWKFNLGGHRVSIMAKKLWMRRDPRRGEVVVFRFPDNPKEDYIKRVIGLPGDKVELRENRLFINDEQQKEALVGKYDGPAGEIGCRDFELYDETLRSEPVDRVHNVIHCRDSVYGGAASTFGPVVVPEGMFFGMGDNRDRSSDSRMWGFIPMSHLKGTAMFIHLPLDPERHYMPRWNRFFKRIR